MKPEVRNSLLRLLHAIRRVTTDPDSEDFQEELFMAAGSLVDLIEDEEVC